MKSNTAFEVQATQLLKDYKPGSSFFLRHPPGLYWPKVCWGHCRMGRQAIRRADWPGV